MFDLNEGIEEKPLIWRIYNWGAVRLNNVKVQNDEKQLSYPKGGKDEYFNSILDNKDIKERLDFNFLDIRPEAGKVIPKVGNFPLRELKKVSRLARYGDHEATEIGGLYNIFVSYVNQSQKKEII